MSKINHSAFLAVGLSFLIAGFAMPGRAEDVRQSRYAVQEVETKDIPVPSYTLPDITGYTIDNLARKIPVPVSGKVDILPVTQVAGLWKFTDRIMLPKLTAFQHGKPPIAIVVQNGIYDLDGLMAAVKNPAYLDKKGSDYFLKVPVYIEQGASLVVRGTVDAPVQLKLSATDGGFIASGGNVYMLNVNYSGWDMAKDDFATFQDEKTFRPFYAAWTGSHSYFGNVNFRSLGFNETKTYGVSLSNDTKIMEKDPKALRPDGWIVGCSFEDMFYAFYSYEAENVAIIGNVFRNNVIYGIDPHDRSRHLIIANNEAYGTHKKHGIIVSREVNDSWIFNNKSHNNHGSGIMIDRNSRNNVIVNNTSYDNEAFGIALFESPQNIVAGNKLTNNKKDGLIVRNSWDIQAIDNTITSNKLSGVTISAKSIDDNEGRDFKEDPYTMRASMNLIGGTIGMNGKGGLIYERIEALRLSDVTFTRPSNESILGNTSLSGRRELLQLLQHNKSFVISPTAEMDTAAE